MIVPGDGRGWFCDLYAGSGCCNFGSHCCGKNRGSRSKIDLFGAVLRGIIDHCDLCRWCDGASAVDFRLSSEKDIKKI